MVVHVLTVLLAAVLGSGVGWLIGNLIGWFFIANGRKGAPFNRRALVSFNAYYAWLKAERPEYKNLVLWGEK